MRRFAAGLTAVLLVALAGCERTDLIEGPSNGAIVAEDPVTVTGVLPEDIPLGGTLTVNGATTPIGDDRSWSAEVSQSTGHVTSIDVLYRTPAGREWRERRAIVNGVPLDEGAMSPEGVGLFMTNSGLDGLGPVVQDLAGDAFDIGELLMNQNPVIDQENALLHFDITGDVYEAGLGGVALAPTSTTNGIETQITISDLYVGLDLHITDGLAINMDCGLELQIPTTTVDATFDLEPDASDPSLVDVNMTGAPVVDTGTVDYEFISGVCDSDSFLIGDIVDAVAGPQVQTLVGEGFSGNLGDPDGTGPEDSPIADAIETALADISIAGSVGDALQAHLNAPFSGISETSSGLDMRANADFYATPGASAADCAAVPGAPDLAATYDLAGSYPQLGATTPSGDPYGLGIVSSASAFNQLLGAMTECGMLNQSLTEIDLGGSTLPITSSLLAIIAPEFGTELPPDTPLTVRIKPTVAPFLTDSAGPNGEEGELFLANLQVEFVEIYDEPIEGIQETTWLSLAVDAPLGFELGYDSATAQLKPTLTPPPGDAVDARVVSNQLGTDEPALEELFPGLFPTFVGSVGDAFGGFPLPGLLGLEIEVLEVARHGNYFVLYSDLNPILETRIENVQVTDLSSNDSATDSIFDVDEWRHRIRPSSSSSSVAVDLKGMVGADACCTTGDKTRSAHAGYQVTFDVIPENGETWQLDLSHLIQGAHTLIDEKVALEDAGGETRFNTPINAQVRIGDGAWQSFNANVTPGAVVHELYGGEGTTNQEFTGSGSTVISGDSPQTITVEVGFDMFVKSDSNAFFPAAGGDEAAIRFGANDTITNGFTAGGYPGRGDRSIVDDGHFLTIDLSSS